MNKESAETEHDVATQLVPVLLQRLLYVLLALTTLSTLAGLLFSLGDAVALVTALAVVAGVLVLVETLPRIIEFTIGPVKAKLGRVEQRQARQSSDIEAIRVALRGLLTKHEFGPLKALDGTDEVKIGKEPNLVKYLHRLDGLNFIQPNPGYGLYNIEQIQDGLEFNIKDYLHITDEGRAYLELTTKLKIYKPGVNWWDPYPWTPLPPSL